MQVNREAEYPSYFHILSPFSVLNVNVKGKADISYLGFGPKDLTPAPPVGFNLTYVCPEGQVFNHDWFATPFVMMTCQVEVF